MALTIMGSDTLMQLFCRSLLITFLHYILLLLGGRGGGEGLIGHFTAVGEGGRRGLDRPLHSSREWLPQPPSGRGYGSRPRQLNVPP